MIPAANAAVPFNFAGREKKSSVRAGPMMIVRPMRKRILPMASSARSKKKRRPRVRKRAPPEQKAAPISVRNEC